MYITTNCNTLRAGIKIKKTKKRWLKRFWSSHINVMHKTSESTSVLKSINPLTVSSLDEFEGYKVLGRSRSQDDVAIEDRPCTPMASKTTKKE